MLPEATLRHFSLKRATTAAAAAATAAIAAAAAGVAMLLEWVDDLPPNGMRVI